MAPKPMCGWTQLVVKLSLTNIFWSKKERKKFILSKGKQTHFTDPLVLSSFSDPHVYGK